MIEIFETQPSDFDTSLQASACYIQVDQKFLLLQKATNLIWTTPGGKLEKGETPLQAAIRELFEETGLRATQPYFLTKLYFRKPSVDFVFHMFQVKLDALPLVTLSKEHQSYAWKSPDEFDSLSLIAGFHEALDYYLALAT
ncbi:MAG: NUDIX hydrolase [Simkaniaceae bacterium]|nr:NUDIX hydrolase [Candidatus Sacchlamyda saccharinae]